MTARGLLAGACMALVLAGCGSDSSSGPAMETGTFVDSAVEGVSYTTSSGGSGTTDAAGELSYLPGDTVIFSIGNLVLGSCAGQDLITPADLTASEDAELNLARFLQSIDDDGDPDNGITVAAAVATVVDDQLAGGAVIDFGLDAENFATDPDLAGLLAAVDTVTTADTETLVSAAMARAHLDATLAGLSGTPAYTIDVSAGDGGSFGGHASSWGGLYLDKDAGDGAVEILASGAADASFTPTVQADPDLGATPLLIDADTVIGVYDPASDLPPAAGVPYQELGLYHLYVSDGDADFANDSLVTGLSIAAGATMTLSDLDGDGYGYGYIHVPQGLVNRGTITIGDVDASSRGHVMLEAANIVNFGTIDTRGRLQGQSGGEVWLLAFGDAAGDGEIVNQGPIVTYGANNSDGDAGNGGEVYAECYVNGRIENTALIDTHGGTASGISGAGGKGGYISLYSYRSLDNAGNIVAHGGDGIDIGGTSGNIELYAFYIGSLRNGGSLDASGGSGKEGRGGPGGYLELGAYGGDVISNGDLLAAGGDSGDVIGDSLPGFGGYLYVYLFGDDHDGSQPAGDALFSGNVDLSGGNAPVAGTGYGYIGGEFYVGIANALDGGSQRLALLGYGLVNAGGGSGADRGGNGGAINLINNGTGPVTNEAMLIVSGGDADPARPGSLGGEGGSVALYGAAGGSSTTSTPVVRGGAGETAGFDGTVSIDISL